MYAGQKMQQAGPKRGGGGAFNVGRATENLEEYYEYEAEDDDFEEDAGYDQSSFRFSDTMRNAGVVRQAAAAAKLRRQTSGESSGQPAPAAAGGMAWGQTSRVEAMKERLLQLQREKIAAMEPDRLELMNMLADRNVNVDEDTITALLVWKRRG